MLFHNPNLADIANKVEHGERLSFDDGVRLFRSNDLSFIGRLAHQARVRLHGKKVYYSINFHMNHTNVCTARCLFCAFARRPGESGGYTFSIDQIQAAVKKAVEGYRINEVHIVGGLNPDLDMDYYLGLCRAIKEVAPHIFIKALTAVEIDDMAQRFKLSWEQILIQLKEAGLDGLPGGGAEIFRETIRRKICADKTTSKDWLEIHRIAHRLGLYSNCTILYGHIESVEDRVDHMLRLRALQDETKGFSSFIPLAFNAENTPIQKLGEPDGYTDLKMCAISRLLLDNIPHIKLHWTSLDLKMASVGLHFGADDLGGTNINEKIMHDAGNETPVDMTEDKFRTFIEKAGFEPILVDSSYATV
ncbi:MAG: aminofutalosine synthase MqnE [Candidatus Omnitrophica bacterium CG11_big_fil_rev_8_21_14_0_20_45_26]|uniref:Aminodeoxyfutalosine synthase n=1 Tax=Candidatus Abzuiibacterium crystallinum TaxID=1974748 RepID=A0A2H0LMS1_9BACT|nr:MAG: aminofutalosine synthase MqnE [Candidatus Omnitrophica bacterium CG11_big_fil_rev_8_21_14_0_20_45_26]PIW64128.1 MAG: aminofutalosine synthase MqnE [Candidatus Omnitrophica bacterium CG12_big_fil_rev_8_21_14_0_65_45_16]